MLKTSPMPFRGSGRGLLYLFALLIIAWLRYLQPFDGEMIADDYEISVIFVIKYVLLHTFIEQSHKMSGNFPDQIGFRLNIGICLLLQFCHGHGSNLQMVGNSKRQQIYLPFVI